MEVASSCFSGQGSKLYQELDFEQKEIRLLNVYPGSGDELICCSLEHAFLSDTLKPVYETISYVWGDPGRRGSVNLQDCEMDVPAGSEVVLRRMRLPHSKRVRG